MTCALETRSVCYRDSELPGVELVSLCAHWGEVLVILGCEDSGVSTLVRLLAGAVTPTAGKVFVDGHDTDHPNPWPRLDPRRFAHGPEASARALVCTAASILLLEEPTEGVDAYEFHKTLMRCRQRADDGDLVVLATHNPHLARIPDATIACIASGRLEAWGDRSVALPRR